MKIHMEPDDFTRALRMMGWSIAMAAHELDLSPRAICYYKSGERRIPDRVARQVRSTLADRYSAYAPPAERYPKPGPVGYQGHKR